MKDKYEKTLKELEQNIPMLEQLVVKPFEKEDVLAQLKTDVSKLEREITIKIQKNQLSNETNVPEKETPVVKMEKSLLPKKDVAERKTKGLRI